MGPEGSNTHVTTRVMGTYGYAAPEYVNTGINCSKLPTPQTLLTKPNKTKPINCYNSSKFTQHFG